MRPASSCTVGSSRPKADYVEASRDTCAVCCQGTTWPWRTLADGTDAAVFVLSFIFWGSFGGGVFIFYFLHLCKSITCHNFSLNDSEEKGSIDVVQLYIYRSATVTLQLYLEALRPSCFICFGRGSGTWNRNREMLFHSVIFRRKGMAELICLN